LTFLPPEQLLGMLQVGSVLEPVGLHAEGIPIVTPTAAALVVMTIDDLFLLKKRKKSNGRNWFEIF
jgi:hypothetical protein